MKRPTAGGLWGLLGGALALSSCASPAPLPTVPRVDLARFMGDWYVISHIPAGSEAAAHNGVESYRLADDGVIHTTYAFRDGGFEGPVVVMTPSAIVTDPATNAAWGMRFFWPFRFEYLVTWLAEDYSAVIVARTARDYAWIMARTPQVDPSLLGRLEQELGRQGYDLTQLRRVPQRWPDPGHPHSAPKPEPAR